VSAIGDLFFRLLADGTQLEADIERQALAAANKAGEKAGVSLGQAMSKGFQRIGGQMQRTGRSLTMGLTLPILGAGAAIVKTGIDFDTTLRQIVALTDTTADEIAGVRKEVLGLATELGKDPDELAKGFYFLASAGFETAEALEVLRSTAKASAAGLGETGDISRVVGAAINAYGKDNLKASDAVDILIRAVKNGSAEAPEFANALGNVLSTAALMGVKFEDATGAIAAMTIAGVNADEATTSLNQVMLSLLNPTTEANKALEGMGTSAEALRQELKEKGLLSFLETLRVKFEGNDTAAGQVFGNVRALRGVLTLLGLDAKQLNFILDDTAHGLGNLDTAYEETEGSGREMDRAITAVKVALIELSEDVLPVFLDALHVGVGLLKTVVGAFKSLPEPVRGGIVQLLGMAAALGPLLFIFGKLTSGIGATIGMFRTLSIIGPKVLAAIATDLGKGRVIASALTSSMASGLDAIPGSSKVKGAIGRVRSFLGTQLGAALTVTVALVVAKVASDEITKGYSEKVQELITEGNLEGLKAARENTLRALEAGKIGPTDFAAFFGFKDGMRQVLADQDAAIAALEAKGGETGEALAMGVKRGIDRGMPHVAAAAEKAAEAAASKIDLSPLGQALGRQIPESIADGILADQNEVTSALSTLRQLMKEELTPAGRIARNIGILTSKELARGLKDQRPGVRAEAQRVQALAEQDLAELIAGGGKVGKKAGDELKKGLRSKNPEVRAAAQRVKDIVTSKLKETVKPAGNAGEAAGNAFVKRLRASIAGSTINVRIGMIGGHGRATGGPVEAGQPYWVGERRRPELFVPDVSGRILTESQVSAAAATSAGPAGGNSTTINMPVSGALPVRTILDIQTEMVRAGDLGLVPDRQLSPMYRRREAAGA
jgi:TP901 family phage tail tape measure protein